MELKLKKKIQFFGFPQILMFKNKKENINRTWSFVASTACLLENKTGCQKF